MNSEQQIEIKPTPTYESASIVKQVNSQGQKEFMNMQNRYQVEKDAVFINYDKEELIKKLKQYPSLDIYERVTYARHLNVIRDQLKEIQPKLVSDFIKSLVLEGQQIKRHLLQELKQLICKVIVDIEKEHIYLEIKEIILPTLLGLLKSGILDIKQQAANLLGKLSGKLKKEEFQLIVKASSELIAEKQEDSKIVGIQVLTKISESNSLDMIEGLVCKEILNAASSQSIRVKKQAILCLPLVCNKVSDHFFQSQILPFFQKKCSQNSWAVRKACVDIITSILQKTTTLKQRSIISVELLSLMKDGNKLVKINAHKILPLYISILDFSHPYHAQDLSYKLLDMYFKLIDSDVNNMAMSSEILYQVSYNFPAVLQNIGKSYWNKMFPIYVRLLKHTQVKIRQPLAYSFHEIAKIIGEQQSKNCLFQCLDNILKDNYDGLKLGAIQHLAEFVEIFNREIKQNLVDVFLVLQKDPKKWRIRHSIAVQLDKLIKIYDSDTVLKYILPISLKLCNDPVAQVSYEACKHVWVVLQSLKEEDSFKLVIESITGYAQSPRFAQRQIFLQVVKYFSQYQKSFQQFIIPELKILARDRITIVRIRLSQLIASLDVKLRQNEQIREIRNILKQDPDEDVRFCLQVEQSN